MQEIMVKERLEYRYMKILRAKQSKKTPCDKFLSQGVFYEKYYYKLWAKQKEYFTNFYSKIIVDHLCEEFNYK